MRLAYLVSSYPMTSTTFIRREIEAIERLGQPVHRFSARPWDVPLVDPDDRAEERRTEYLLTGHVPALLLAALAEPFVNGRRLLRAVRLARALHRRAGGGLARHLGYLVQAIRFRSRAAALAIDHVHVHFSNNAAAIALIAHALGGPRYSFTVHGPDELVDPARNGLAIKARHAAFVVAITHYCRARIEAEAPDTADRIAVIPCGIDLGDFPASPVPPAGVSRVVCVGRLCANKAQALIPKAVALVRDRFPDLVVELIGDGEARGEIDGEIARLGLSDHVRLLGWKSNPEVRRHLDAAAALLLPSFAEGLPIVIMEALALERPVLVTAIAGIPELVDAGCGWIFPPGEPERIAEALAGLLATPDGERAALGREGRRRVEARHDIAQSAEALLAAFVRGSVAEAGPASAG